MTPYDVLLKLLLTSRRSLRGGGMKIGMRNAPPSPCPPAAAKEETLVVVVVVVVVLLLYYY